METAVGTGGTVDQKIAVETSRAQNAESALGGRVTTLETAVGSGGSVDSRIAAAKAEIKGNATSACDTLGEAEALISAEKTRAQATEQSITTTVTSRLDTQDAEIALLNGAEVIVVEDHTQVSSPDPQKIYREIGTSSYTDWMNQGSGWKAIATYTPGIEDEPTAGSNNLVKSGGIAKYTDQINFNLEDTLSQPIRMSSGYIVCNGAVGSVVNLTPVSHNTYKYSIVPCNPKDVFYIKGKGGESDRLYCFIDADNKIINNSGPRTEWSTYNFVITPDNAAKIIINDETGQAISYHGIKFTQSYGMISQETIAVPNVIMPFFKNSTQLSFEQGYIYTNVNVGSIVDLTPQPSSSTCYCILNCNQEDYFNLNDTYGGRDARLYCFLDADNRVLAVAPPNIYLWNVYSSIIKAPKHSAKVIFQTRLEDSGTVHILNKRDIIGSHSFDVYCSSEATFTDNSVTLKMCIGIVGDIYVVHSIYEQGSPIQAPITFTFNENGYLVYKPSTGKARIVTSYSSIEYDDLIWLYYKDGKIIGGLLYPNYISYKVSLNEDSWSTVKKRAKQLATIEWTAKNPIANITSSTGISAGKHIGIPYTSCMEVDKFVGWDVTLKTFITAANNPYSLLYTEDLKRNISGYGFTYHGNRDTIGGYMGIVCNIFALYSTCLPIPYDTGNWDYLRRVGIFNKLNTQDFKYAEIGDLIWEPGHASVVTDVTKDYNGDVINIMWAESVNDFPYTHSMTTSQANNRLSESGGIIYRINGINKYLSYERSPFVSTIDESIDQYTYNNDICTFGGDYAAFREGQIIYLNYNLSEVGDWDSVEIYKNDTLVDTLNIDPSIHEIDLTSLNLEYGKYKARMKSGSNYSDYTYFEIIETSVSLSYIGSTMKVEFSSANGNPDYLRLCTIDGGPICIIPIHSEDAAKGFVEFNPFYYINRQGYSSVQGGTYLKVHFSGEYGCVTNEPILTNL